MWEQIKQHPKAVLVALLIHLALLAFFVISVGSKHETPAAGKPIQAQMHADANKVAEIKRQIKAKPKPVEKPKIDQQKLEQEKLEALKQEREKEQARLDDIKLEQEKVREEAKQEDVKKQKITEQKKIELKKKQVLIEKKRLAEKQRKADELKKAEAKKQADEKKKAEQQRTEKEKAKKDKAAAEKKLVDDKKEKLRDERKKREQEQARLDKLLDDAAAEKKRLAEMFAAEDQAYASQAAEQERIGSLREQYLFAIKSRVQSRWLQPVDGLAGSCEVYVRQTRSGAVLEVKVQSSLSCSSAMKKSVEQAVRRADPLPTPPDPGIFDRDINFTFEPEA